jgi:predicted metal-dependent hydrolase
MRAQILASWRTRPRLALGRAPECLHRRVPGADEEAMGSSSGVVLRADLDLDVGAVRDPMWNPGAPEFVAAANSVSLMMPYVEPYFAATVRRAADDLGPELRATARAFADQEVQHQREHRRFNALLRGRYPRLERVERRMRRTYAWLGRTRSLRFNLAFAAASETIAYSLARWTSDHLAAFLRGADPAAADLFLWHLAEEVEHKSVAHDVWADLDDSHLRLGWAGICSLVLLAWFSLPATLAMLRAERRLRSPATWWRLGRLLLSFAFEVVPTMLVSSLPGHHPSQLADPDWYRGWLVDLELRRGARASGDPGPQPR